MKIIYFLSFIFIYVALSGLPILTDVTVCDSNDVVVNFTLINLPKDSVSVRIVCFNPTDKTEFKGKITVNNIKQGKNVVKISKSELPKDFNLKKYRILPKLYYRGRIYYEMKKIKAGSYPYSVEKGVMDVATVNKFYISKFEITNEQFEAFVNADGYEFQEYWEVSPDLMSKEDIGWYYLSKYKMTLPHGWSFKEKPYYKKAQSNFKYSPVTNIRWFEAYAFANWMNCELPSLEQLKVAFIKSKVSGKGKFSGITEFANCKYPIQKVRDGVSEWLESGVEPNSLACAGCNEMYFIENNSDYVIKKLTYLIKCPLFRAPFLGARLVYNTDRSRIK